ncbi:class II histone deacetylase [Polaromonas sp. YR568]|uniref:class II histone deacetylase n=1 Tax=Polaromonas sp. YR568 TaxID=1855301 RepID=UPI00398BDBDE
MWHITGMGAGAQPAGGFMEPGLQHIDSPASKRRMRNLIEVSGLIDHLAPVRPRPATEEELLRVHTPGYIGRLKRLSAQGGGDAGEKAPVGPGSWEIAQLAAGGCLAAADAIMAGTLRNAYALVRPSGHHAEPERGRGFCLLANGALAVAHLRAVHGLRRIALVDWDVHHGNGAQGIFYEDPGVLTISLHEEDNYPRESGGITERGRGPGFGANINVPLPPGSGHGAYLAAIEQVVLPALERFAPEMILVSSGYDACLYDPLARQMAMMETFRLMARALVDAADRACSGRLLVLQEGGYSDFYAPLCGLAVVEELSGHRTAVQDPFVSHLSRAAQRLQPHQAEVIDAAAKLVEDVPRIWSGPPRRAAANTRGRHLEPRDNSSHGIATP